MTYAAGQAEPTDSPILHAAIAMAPQIRASADEIERARRLPASIVEALKAAGVFGMAMPRAWGGPELDPMTQFRVLEALAMADASVAWCVMINCDGGYITAFLDQDVGRAMYPDLEVGTAAAATPTGQAQLCPAAIASADDSRSPAAASIANGSGSAVLSPRMGRRVRTAMVCRKPGSAS